MSQAEHPTSAQFGLCVYLRQSYRYQLFYFCFVTFLLTDLSAFNSQWHLMGTLESKKVLRLYLGADKAFFHLSQVWKQVTMDFTGVTALC